ncbi:MAG: DUF2330 domain-containing protein [Myxococcota bacterium]
MRFLGWMIVSVAGALALLPSPAHACGGFFCGQQPVDQTAERIVFAVGEGETDMIVQLSYEGKAEDFAWVLPLAAVPVDGSLDVFPQTALSALDAATAPQFNYDWSGCPLAFDAEDGTGSGPPSSGDDGGVTVHLRETVGPFDTVVIEGTDSDELVQWLRDNGFRVTEAMIPYIDLYVQEGNKLLALRLQPGQDVSDIQPFRLTLPGETPSIPIRMTAVAAEPEMGILTFVLADRRFEPKNWPELDIADEDVVLDPTTGRSNWPALVAKAVDRAGGEGFETELAEPTDSYAELLANSLINTEEQEEARDALLPLLEAHPYITRMYTRLSAEEMGSDPVFGRAPSDEGDVSRFHTIPIPDDFCAEGGWWDDTSETVTPCDLTTCGAGGLCRNVENDEGELVAGCACVPGATARTTFDPRGDVMVACQDKRMSFLNPGERATPDETRLPDPCVDFDCGPGGECVAMNMTPTCQCDDGLVAVGWLDENGERRTRCETPTEPVPSLFYQGRLASTPMPGGREVHVEPPDNALSGGGCAVTSNGAGSPVAAGAVLGLLALVLRRRRRG